ncbi:transglutaminaseTgpA domain-containing protein [Lysinibacillus sp. KU-BSD001]|uniref:transglutaminase TgpA family protein n=1 Tax=Lysinibacillus sp. KU-BSD001 TaxID=3141328 RepID=UPI0036ED4AA9
MKKDVMQYVELSLYYVILFFILREWLVPVVELTSTGHLNLLLLFIVLAFVLNLFQAPIVVSWLAKFTYIAWFVVHVYSEEKLWSAAGLQFLQIDIKRNVEVVFAGQWEGVTDPFRSVLFFLLIWMLIYLIHHWLTVRMTIFYFFVLTVFFIATLDTFTSYNGAASIVKVVLLGLIMTAFLYMKRLIVETGTSFAFYKYMRYILPITLAIGVVGMVAILLPKAAPQWPDPVPYIKSLSGTAGSGGTSISKVGFGEDDSRLGGSFEGDDTVVFYVHAPERQYWRVETKDLYTGKGWESTSDLYSLFEITDRNVMNSVGYNEQGDWKRAEVFPAVVDKAYVLQPYGIRSFHTRQSDITLQFNRITERLTTKLGSTDTPVDSYSIDYSTPEYSYTELKTPVPASELMTMDERYLQLPAELPERVRQLAFDITQNHQTGYDKARAIEQYFKRNGFTYDTKDVAIPTETQDYVDQFLFETKIGYCDNFSTSMVVMLRSIGIPARWVKGFANGTETGRFNEELRVFEIENNDAHSWVEAYIDGVGWMPFEPTIGFVNQADINFDMETTESEELLLEQEKEQQELKEQQVEEQAVQQEKAKKQQSISIDWKWLVLALLALAGVGYVFFKNRRKWFVKMHVNRQRRQPTNATTLQKSYKVLLKQLESVGLKRGSSETLQAFATRVDDYFGTDDMSKITDLHEKTIYSKDMTHFNFDEIKESWEYLINRTTG